MSLSTLLAAAEYLEMQEMEEKQQRAAAQVEAAAAARHTTNNIHIKSIEQQQQVVIPATTITTKLPTNQNTAILAAAAAAASGNNGGITTINLTPNNIKKETGLTAELIINNTVINSNGIVAAASPLNQQQMQQQQQQQQRHRFINNSFDIMNPFGMDETNGTNGTENKRKQPPMAFRAGTREVHNKLEKHRRAHLKECFDVLKKQLPLTQDEKKTSNLSILHNALKCIQLLKRKEKELEHEMERLAREKIAAQNRLSVLRKEISSHCDVDFSKILPDIVVPNDTTNNDHLVHHNHHHLLHNNKETPVTSSGLTAVGAATAAVINNHHQQSNHSNNNNNERIPVPLLPNNAKPPQISIAASTTQIKEVATQPVQTTALSVLPMPYPVNQVVLQKLAIVPKGLTDLTPLVSTHFITQQQINGKVVPLVNAQYVVKPVVVVSRPS